MISAAPIVAAVPSEPVALETPLPETGPSDSLVMVEPEGLPSGGSEMSGLELEGGHSDSLVMVEPEGLPSGGNETSGLEGGHVDSDRVGGDRPAVSDSITTGLETVGTGEPPCATLSTAVSGEANLMCMFIKTKTGGGIYWVSLIWLRPGVQSQGLWLRMAFSNRGWPCPVPS